MKTVKLLCIMVLLMTIVYSQVLLKGYSDARLAPRLLNYQGYLTDDQGIPITDPSLSMTFSVYDALSSGNQKWTETQTSVDVNKGVFSVLLGSVTPIPDSVFTSNPDRWLELIVDGQALSPRTRIVSNPYAYTSTYSDTALYAFNAAADNDWTFLISDGADTTLQMDGRWGLARPGNTVIGYFDSTHVCFGVGSITGFPGQNFKYCTVGGGSLNKARGTAATIAGGYNNHCSSTGNGATIGGGYNNNAGHEYSTVAGGSGNYVSQAYGTIGGGYGNQASGHSSIIGGGYQNRASNDAATIAGGMNNRARGPYSVVAGGGGETVVDSNSAIGSYSAIGGGRSNIASVEGATVSGGLRNTASGIRATVGGGLDNTASGLRATVGGGYLNTASFQQATVGGGYNNIASGVNATVGGGENNIANQLCAAVGGGYCNYAAGAYSAILGGYADTIFATGDYSYLFGINSNLTHDSTFMVDLPHIRFGTEATGYEFPITDGSSGQALVTDGSGKVSWGSTNDNDWTFLISDGADTTLQMGGHWGIARAGNTLYGNADSTHTNFGVACTTGTSGQNRKYCTVGGGFTNKASSAYTTVGGGVGNVASSYWATVGGGNTNSASGQYTTVGGGYQNSASGNHATVGGGYGNYAVGSQSIVGGGYNNGASKQYAAVGGGWYNFANGYVATISGGEENAASNDYATVGGGRQNTASGLRATVGGGYLNTASFQQATVGGGYNNIASGVNATVGGGENNIANQLCAAVGGGYCNYAAGAYSAILGGCADTITATGDYSYLFGINSNLTQDSTFMVDMPHIRFGTEAAGYEFPTIDGSSGQALVTDGSGKVSWGSTNDNDWFVCASGIYSGIAGEVGVGITDPSSKLDVSCSNGYEQFRMRTTYTPSSSSDPNGNVGDVAWDDSYVYIKTSAGWKRSALTTW